MKKSYLAIAALFALLILFNFSRPAFISRIRPGIIDFMELPLKVTTKFVKGFYNLATFQNRYEKKIAALEERIAVLQGENIQTKEFLEENERLRKLISFKSRFASRVIAAEVIARDESSWDTYVIIDKGSADGIMPNMSAAKNDGLVGRVFEVGERTAKIMLIDNHNSKLSAAIQRTREQGVLIGLGSGLCKLIYLAYNTEARPGDVVIASELSNLSTKGIMIGEVIKVIREARSLYASAIVRPSSNLFKIEEVLCVE